MANLFGGFFKQIEKPQDIHPPSVTTEFSQYDNEYITYCIEHDQIICKLESKIHSCDDPKEISMLTLQTACTFYAADWTGIIEVDMELGVTTTGWWHNPRRDGGTIPIQTSLVCRKSANLKISSRWRHGRKLLKPNNLLSFLM